MNIIDNQEENDQIPDYEIREAFMAEKERITQSHNQMSKDYMDLRIRTYYHRQDFLKHIILISAGILSLATLISKAQQGTIIYSYFIIGIFLYMAVVIFSLSYIRCKIDNDIEGLEKDSLRFKEVHEERRGNVEKFLKKNKLTQESLIEYEKIKVSTPMVRRLIEDKKKIDTSEKMEVKRNMDYFLEVVIFLFSSASFFMLISFINFNMEIYAIILMVIIIFAFSFFDYTAHFSKVINFVRKKL
ncbi:MAG: hypothetical protein HQ530_00320 [Parcubacteria group bacterium]|nr:hypothetical protein [Parcubacteria group bacterium]